MAQIISIVNQKGGVGKTTTSINLAAYLATKGRFVLLVDIDPQSNATSGIGIDHSTLDKTIYDVLIGKTQIKDIILNTNISGFKIAPACVELSGANVELVNLENRELILYQKLIEIRNDFDYIIIDCPPSLGPLTINGLVAADQILVPVQAEYFALEGLGQLLNTINLIKNHLRPEIEILGAVLTMFDKRNRLSEDVLNELYKFFPERIFRSVIPRNVRLTESPSHGKTILEYDPKSKGGRAYERLAIEILKINEG